MIIGTIVPIAYVGSFTLVADLSSVVQIVPGDAILYDFPNNNYYWFKSLSFEIIGDMCADNVTAVSLDCADLSYTFINQTLNTENVMNYLYLSENMMVQFNLLESDVDDNDLPYYIWMFEDSISADDARMTYFDDLACNSPPADVKCIRITEDDEDLSKRVIISKNTYKYYFIRCEQDENCSLLSNVTRIGHTIALPSPSDDNIIDYITFEHEGTLSLQQSFFHPVQNEVCVVLKIHVNDCNRNDMVHFIQVQNSQGNDVFILTLGLAIVVWIIVITFGVICCVARITHKLRMPE